MKTQVITAVSGEALDVAAREGAQALREGKLVGFATETVYGIAANAADAKALDRLRELKDRPARPFSVHVGRPQDVYRYVANPPELARRLVTKGMPGPLTLLLPTGGQLSDPAFARDGDLYARLVADEVIGIRCPAADVAMAMLSAVDAPIVAPSANLAGKPSPRTAQEVLDSLDGRIDLLIDSGPTRFGRDSTIVDFTGPSWRIVRQGVLDERMIQKMLSRLYVFVCTGNTCRSPIASGLARMMLARQLGVSEKDLGAKGVEVVSAGLYATEGSQASPEAIDAAGVLGSDISAHRSHKLTSDLIHSADMVFCMTQFHVEQVLEVAPEVASKVVRLDDDADIPDPIGGDADEYRQVARQIQAALQRRLDKGLL